MKKLLLVSMFVSSVSGADVLIHAVAKYGPNGYEASGVGGSSSSSCVNRRHHRSSCTITSTAGSTTISDRVDLVPGISLTTTDNISLQVQLYLDTTVVVGIGVKL